MNAHLGGRVQFFHTIWAQYLPLDTGGQDVALVQTSDEDDENQTRRLSL